MWRTNNSYSKSRFFKIEAARRATSIKRKVVIFQNRSRPVRDSCPGRKNPGLEFEKKMIGYGILPGCPGRVCPVIAQFLAGGQSQYLTKESR